MDTKTKVACYCRVSTSSKDQYNSFENQQSYFLRELSNLPDFELINIYADRGISGTLLYKRPNFNQMLNDAGLEIINIERVNNDTGVKYQRYSVIPSHTPKFKYIYTTNTSRFARNVEVATVLNALKDNGVYVVFLDERLSTENTNDIMRIQQKQIYDEDESRVKSQRVKRGIEESQKRNRLFVNNNIYGYHYNKTDNRLEIIEHEAEIVQLIFKLYSQNLGTRRIANYLAEKRITTRSGLNFTYSTIRAILNNVRYTGVNVYNKYNRSRVFEAEQYSKVRKREEWIIQESDKVPAIISTALYEECQNILASKKSHTKNKGINRGKGKFAGLIYCAKCGATYNQTGANGRKFFMCSTKKKHNATACNNPNINYSKMEEAIISDNYLHELWKYRLVYIKQLNNLVLALQGKLENNNTAEIEQCRNELEKYKKDRDMLVKLFKDRIYTEDELEKELAPIKPKIISLEEKLLFYSKSNADIKNDITDVKKTIGELSCFRLKETYTQEEIIKDIERITIGADGSIDIMFKTKFKLLELRDKHDNIWNVLADERLDTKAI